MTHDERWSRRTTCKECGYIRGRHEKDELVTVASVLDAMEEGAGGSRWPRFLSWPSGSVRAGFSLRRWNSAAASFSSASRPQRPRAGAFGYGGWLDAARASTAGGSRAARPVSAWALAGAGPTKAASPSPKHGRDDLPRLYGHSDRGYIAYGQLPGMQQDHRRRAT